MAFPYFNPNANAPVTSGYGFFRLKQALSSAGDIFESAQGAHAFALGPDSDVSLATIAYVDTQSRPTFSSQTTPTQTNMNTLTVSPQRAFVSPFPAVNDDTQYAPSSVPGRILIWPTEIYDATFLPPGFDSNNDRLVRENPVIDILQFFSPPTTVIPARADKTYYYDTLPFGSSKICYVLIPYYGRRYASVWIMNNNSGGAAMGLNIQGVNFRQSETASMFSYLVAATTGSVNGDIPAGTTRSLAIGTGYNEIVQLNRDVTTNAAVLSDAQVYNAGLFDYLMLEVDGGGVTPGASLKVVVSDTMGRGVL